MLKSLARQLIKEDHWHYMSWIREKYGLYPALASYLSLRKNGIGIIRSPLTGNDVYVRPGTTDQDVFDEIFHEREYDLDLGDPQVIVDAGAHIGLSSIYFASKYPKATIIAIEPEPSNFEMLLKNVQKYQNITPIRAGLWSKTCHLFIRNNQADTWSFQVEESSTDTGIPAVSVSDVMAEHHLNRIDVLKVDIEGSEVEVMNGSANWVDSVRVLIIELHDRFRPGCTQALEDAFRNHRFDRTTSGESVVLRNIQRA